MTVVMTAAAFPLSELMCSFTVPVPRSLRKAQPIPRLSDPDLDLTTQDGAESIPKLWSSEQDAGGAQEGAGTLAIMPPMGAMTTYLETQACLALLTMLTRLLCLIRPGRKVRNQVFHFPRAILAERQFQEPCRYPAGCPLPQRRYRRQVPRNT